MITVSAFKNTSSELVVSSMHFPKVILPNDKDIDFAILLPFIQKSDFVFCFGQKPGLKDKICIEIIANDNGNIIQTDFDIDTFEKILLATGVQSKRSFNPGNSFCNTVYYKSLKYIESNKINCRLVFIHVPYINRICDIKEFTMKLENAISTYLNQ